MFVDSSSRSSLNAALMASVDAQVIDVETHKALIERVRHDAALRSVLDGAHAALRATNNHTDFNETIHMLGDIVRNIADENDDEFANAPAQLDEQLLLDARRVDEAVTRAALDVFAQTRDMADLIDTLVRVCAVHDAPAVANRRRVLCDQAMLARGDLSFLVLSDDELSVRIATAEQRRQQQRSSFAAWFAGANVSCPFAVVDVTNTDVNSRVPLVDNDDDDNDDDDASNSEFRQLLVLRGADATGQAELTQTYDNERKAANSANLQFMHSPSLLSFEENRFLARP
jgi:hypothetical protein